MSITRRIFTSGLAAVLSLFRIPSLSASVNQSAPEDDGDYGTHEVRSFEHIEYLAVGEREEMMYGPAEEAGWYLHPVCSVGCCESEGPFLTKEEAIEADRIRWEEIAEGARRDPELSFGSIEPF